MSTSECPMCHEPVTLNILFSECASCNCFFNSDSNYPDEDLQIYSIWFNVNVKDSDYRIIYDLKEKTVTINKITINNYYMTSVMPSYGGILKGLPTSVFSLYGFSSIGPISNMEYEEEICKFAFSGVYKITPLNAKQKLIKYINF